MAGDIRDLAVGLGMGGVRQFERGAAPGQPTRVRTWGIPTGPGWFDRVFKWNFWGRPIRKLRWAAVSLISAFTL